MNQTEQEILLRGMEAMDRIYDDGAGLIRGTLVGEPDHHDVRGSSQYAVGLLSRGDDGDFERAEKVIRAVLANQIIAPDEIYHGTFKLTPGEPHPPQNAFPWREISPEARFFGDKLLDLTANSFFRALEEEGEPAGEVRRLEKVFEAALLKNFPVAWKTYDPNWREFVSSAFAVALALFEYRIPAQLVLEMENSMKECVRASIDRRNAGLYPMNTNIELMHIFVCDFYGARFHDSGMTGHAAARAAEFYDRYMEYHSVSEYNSPTYCGVDLYALALWRRFGSTAQIREKGAELEAGLWEDLAQFYNPNLDQFSGPFSRCYEMDMSLHTSMQALLYLALGPEHREYPKDNCELSYYPILALSGIVLPGRLKPDFLEHSGDRQVTTRFKEMIERGIPGDDQPLCTATAWIGESLMLGAMSGSRNISGQLHPATAYWNHNGQILSMRLGRRHPGHYSGEGIRTVFFNGQAEKNRLNLEVRVDTQRDVEILFEFIGRDVDPDKLCESCWTLPGLMVRLSGDAPPPRVVKTDNGAEVLYLSRASDSERTMTFQLEFTQHNS